MNFQFLNYESMATNCKAVHSISTQAAHEVLCHCIEQRTQVQGKLQPPSLTSFATWIIDGAELDIGGRLSRHLSLCSSGSGLHRPHAGTRCA